MAEKQRNIKKENGNKNGIKKWGKQKKHYDKSEKRKMRKRGINIKTTREIKKN